MSKTPVRRNRKTLVLIGTLLSLAVLGIAGWGSYRQFGGQIAQVFSGDSDKPAPKVSKLREFDNPVGRANWFMYQRKYPFKKVPDGARRRAWDQVKARGEGFGPQGAGSTWTSIGPTPTAGAGPGGDVSGRINEIAVHPTNNQILLVAGATGGIWRSTNGGTTFVPVSDSQADLAVGSIAFAPSNPNIVYAGMGDNDNSYFGSGVLKSTDAGATWTRVNNNSLPDKVRSTRIKVDPANPDKVYLSVFNSLDTANCPNRNTDCAGNRGGIYFSTNGGVNWTRSLIGNASDLAIHPTDSQIVYAALRLGEFDNDPRGLFKSTDGGTTFPTNVFPSPFTATADFRVAVTPADPDRVYIYYGEDGSNDRRLQMSTDAGATFTMRPAIPTGTEQDPTGLDPAQFAYNTYLVADPTNADTVWVGSRDFFRSTDGGATFTNLNNSFKPPYTCNDCFQEDMQKVHTDQQSFAFLPGSATTFFVGNDGGIFKTTDSGATFTSLNTTLSLTQFTGIAIHPTNGARSYAGAQDNGSQRRNAGTNWNEFTATGDGGKIVIDAVTPSIIFLSATNGAIDRNTENGNPQSSVPVANAATFGATQDPPRIEFFAPVVGNGTDNKLYSGSWRLYICTDCDTAAANAATWTAPSMTDLTKGGNDVLTAIAVARSNPMVIYTGSRDGGAMRSTDSGATWTNITAGLPNRSITNISVSATDPTLVYLTVSGYESAGQLGHVFRSTNSGTTWTNISNGLENVPTNAILIDPATPTTLYAGTDIGVFRSTDSGANWAIFNTGLPPVPVMGFSAQPVANGKIQLATYGRGAYELGAAAAPVKSRADFDGDGRTDLSVFRPSEGNWYLNQSTDGFAGIGWGQATDTIVPADYDGDGKADVAVFRPVDAPGTPDFYILNSNGFVLSGFEWGVTGDLPVVADYDGDKKDDIAVFRPSTNTWYIRNSGGGTVTAEQFGSAGDIPLTMDFEGDGKANLTVFRPSDNNWYIARPTGVPATNFDAIPFGSGTDKLVPGDYDGDSKDDIAVFRPSTGQWFVRSSGSGSVSINPFGTMGDIPVPGDYDGDGRDDFAVYRVGAWWIKSSQSGGTSAVAFGVASDIPIPSRANP